MKIEIYISILFLKKYYFGNYLLFILFFLPLISNTMKNINNKYSWLSISAFIGIHYATGGSASVTDLTGAPMGAGHPVAAISNTHGDAMV
jgi:uncharacterized membrane protein YfhO